MYARKAAALIKFFANTDSRFDNIREKFFIA